jgi:predicted kinase
MKNYPILFVMCGLPASGKSTEAAMIAERANALVFSSDAIRAELYGDENIQGDPVKVFSLLNKRVVDALKSGRNVVYDATNLNAKKRRGLLRFFRTAGCVFDSQCVLVLCPYEQCLKRDAARERHVGEEVLHRMLLNFQPPFHNEGWDFISVVGLENNDSEYITFNRIEDAYVFDQKNSHHSMFLADHEEAAANYLLDYRIEHGELAISEALIRAAYFHDDGKMDCQHFDEEGEAHYYGHEYASAYRYLTCWHAVMDKDEYKANLFLLEAAFYIAWHMVPYKCQSKESFMEWCEKKNISTPYSDNLWLLHEADVAAH